MRIFMETEAVRGMAAKARQTADSLDGRADAILSQTQNMDWQSNARQEFDESYQVIHRNLKSIARAMRTMGSAADEKAHQWETIASKLMGPFVAIRGLWREAMDSLGAIVAIIGGIIGGIILKPFQWPPNGSNIYHPLPFVPGRGNQGPSWKPPRPDWLPNTRGAEDGDTQGPAGGGEGGSAGGGGGGGGGGSSGGPTQTPRPSYKAGDWNGRFTEVDRLGSEIKNLEQQLAGDPSNTALQTQLSDLRSQRNELMSTLDSGIPASATPNDKRAILGGCTNYVATKRDVSAFWKPGKMNAHYWNENAAAAGFEVGNRPVKGSIMVVEADHGGNNGIMNVDDQAGHVLYVEGVTETDGGYMVSYSHAGTLYDEAGSYIPGKYKMLNSSAPVFVPYESAAVSFIYDKV